MKNIELDLVKLCSVNTDISICSTHAGTENFSEISFYPSIYSHPPKWDIRKSKYNRNKNSPYLHRARLKMSTQQKSASLLFFMYFSMCFFFLNNHIASKEISKFTWSYHCILQLGAILILAG